MNYSKKLLIGFMALTIAAQSNAQNLPGRTRNLNVFRCNQELLLQFYANKNDSGNVLRDLACNCDNADFELNLQSTIKPFGMLNRLESVQKIEDLEQLITDPVIVALAEIYTQRLLQQAERNIQVFVEDNLKEMLFSRDKDGKTVADILQEKQSTGKAGCIILKAFVDGMTDIMTQAEENQKEKKAIEESINKMIH